MQSLRPTAPCPLPSQVSNRALPRIEAIDSAPLYGVAGSNRVPTTTTGLVVAAAGGCRVWRSGAQ